MVIRTTLEVCLGKFEKPVGKLICIKDAVELSQEADEDLKYLQVKFPSVADERSVTKGDGLSQSA